MSKLLPKNAEKPHASSEHASPNLTGPDIPRDAAGYWRATLRLTLSLLGVWFLASYGAGILFRDALDNFSIGGAPLGFWFAQNGAIYVFLALIVIYCRKMTHYESKFGIKA